MLEHKERLTKTTEGLGDFVVIHALDPEDASAIIPMRTAGHTQKGVRFQRRAADRRTNIFRCVVEGVSPRDDATFESATVGDVPGLWVHPASSRSDEAVFAVETALAASSRIH
jgi:monoterpene epsilon-lactone hydrolase